MSKIMQKLNRKLFTKNTLKNESVNPYTLIENLKDILYLISLLRQRIDGLKIKKINELVINEIDFFSSSLIKSDNIDEEEINKAKYLICAAFDESYAYFCEKFDKDARYITLISHYCQYALKIDPPTAKYTVLFLTSFYIDGLHI